MYETPGSSTIMRNYLSTTSNHRFKNKPLVNYVWTPILVIFPSTIIAVAVLPESEVVKVGI